MKDAERIGNRESGTWGRTARGRAAIGAGLVAFGGTLALLLPATWGASSASADDPSAAPGNAEAVAAEFEPAVPSGDISPTWRPIGDVRVDANIGRDEDGQPAVVVVAVNEGHREARLECAVALQVVEFPESSMMMRVLPEPQVKQVLFSAQVSEKLGPGQSFRRVFRLPAGVDVERPAGDDGAMRRLVIE